MIAMQRYLWILPALLIALAGCVDGAEQAWEKIENPKLLTGPVVGEDQIQVSYRDGKTSNFKLAQVSAFSAEPRNASLRTAQAKAAGLSGVPDRELLRLGVEANAKTQEWLKQPFSIWTRWEKIGSGGSPVYLAYVVTEAGELSELLMANGLGYLDPNIPQIPHPDGRSADKIRFGLELLRAQASEQLLGVHALKPPPNAQVRGQLRAGDTKEILERIGESTTIEGRVGRVGATANGDITFINFENNERSGFVAIVRKEGLAAVKKVWPEFPQDARGREVIVRGTIEEYRGAPQILIRDADQIQPVR